MACWCDSPPAGRDAVDAAMEELLEHERAILAHLPGRNRSALASALRTLLSAVENPTD